MDAGRPLRPRYTEVLTRVVDTGREGEGRPRIRIVPFIPGWRPTDEATHPGLGSSDQAALLLGRSAGSNRAFVLFGIAGRSDEMSVDATLRFAGPAGDVEPGTVPGWDARPLELRCFDGPSARLRAARPDDTQFVLVLEPERDLWPGETWSWSELGDE